LFRQINHKTSYTGLTRVTPLTSDKDEDEDEDNCLFLGFVWLLLLKVDLVFQFISAGILAGFKSGAAVFPSCFPFCGHPAAIQHSISINVSKRNSALFSLPATTDSRRAAALLHPPYPYCHLLLSICLPVITNKNHAPFPPMKRERERERERSQL